MLILNECGRRRWLAAARQDRPALILYERGQRQWWMEAVVDRGTSKIRRGEAVLVLYKSGQRWWVVAARQGETRLHSSCTSTGRDGGWWR